MRLFHEKDESIINFNNRVTGSATSYLNVFRTGIDPYDSQVVAMKLLYNSELPSQTFSSLVSSMIKSVSSTERILKEVVTLYNNTMIKVANLLESGKYNY